MIITHSNKPTNNINFEALQQLLDQFKQVLPSLEMSRFLSNVEKQDGHMCATSCCLAGWAIEWKINTTPEIDKSWKLAKDAQSLGNPYCASEYTNLITDRDADVDYASQVFEWIFGGNWSDNPGHAIQRLEYFLKHKCIPAIYSTRTYSDISLFDLLDQLPMSNVTNGYNPASTENIQDFISIELEQMFSDVHHRQNPQLPTFILNVYRLRTIDRESYIPTALNIHKSDIPKFLELISPFHRFDKKDSNE